MTEAGLAGLAHAAADRWGLAALTLIHRVGAMAPGETIVETKSLKFYLASFRNQPAFNEEIVNRILDDLVAALKPQELVVRGEFAPRGGIQLTSEATYPEKA